MKDSDLARYVRDMEFEEEILSSNDTCLIKNEPCHKTEVSLSSESRPDRAESLPTQRVRCGVSLHDAVSVTGNLAIKVDEFAHGFVCASNENVWRVAPFWPTNVLDLDHCP